MIMVTLFRDWGTLAAVISTATLVAYLTGQQQLFHYFKANILKFMAPLSFVLASLAIYWAMMNWKFNTIKQIGGSLWIIIYLIVLAFLSFIGSKEFKGMNWIHYPWDFLVIAIVALIFYQLGTTSYFESIYFKRANKLNKKMGDKLRKRRRKARHKDWKERDRQEQNN